jgi:hypothetical protein
VRGGASLREMIHLQWETTASPPKDAVSPVGDFLASPKFGICDTTPFSNEIMKQVEFQSKKRSTKLGE